MAFFHDCFELFEERFDLGAFGEGIGLNEAWMTANLAQAQQGGEEMELVRGEFLLGLDPEQGLLGALEFGAIEGFLLALDFAEEVLFDAIREIFCHLRLGSPQEEGTHARREPPSRAGYRSSSSS